MKNIKDKLFFLQEIIVDWLLFQIFNFIGSSVIYLSLSEIPIWTHQRHFGLNLRRMTNMQHIYEETIKGVANSNFVEDSNLYI
jgi:hypothetical protein